MSGFENHQQQVREIEREIIRNGMALGIDWDDPLEVRLLAQEALECNPNKLGGNPDDLQQRTRYELFGLIHLMLQVMTESAGEGIETHGGATWKTLARALWSARECPPR